MITFYGHFSGWSSYPVVCRAIAEVLAREGVRFQVCDLRDGPGYATLQAAEPEPVPYEPVDAQLRQRVHEHAARTSTMHAHLRPVTEPADGVGLVFGFPEWVLAVPRHEVMIGYHVCDYERIPEHWVTIMNQHVDRVLTPSQWCYDVFRAAGVVTPIAIVRHGFDPRVFRGSQDSDIQKQGQLLHLCSAREPQRKGTHWLIQAFEGAYETDPALRLTIRTQSPKVHRWVRASSARSAITIEAADSLAPRQMAEYYQRFYAVVQPSEAEGFGMVPLEAAACGAQTFFTATTGSQEYARDLEPHGITLKTNEKREVHVPYLRSSFHALGNSSALDPWPLNAWHWETVLQPLVSLLRALA